MVIKQFWFEGISGHHLTQPPAWCKATHLCKESDFFLIAPIRLLKTTTNSILKLFFLQTEETQLSASPYMSE